MQALYNVLPNKAKTIMDRLIAISQDAVIKLGAEPASTIEYVNILKYVSVPLFYTESLHYTSSRTRTYMHVHPIGRIFKM